MGVPTLFRWLADKCPKCLKPAVEVDESLHLRNKNGEFQVLYIDANDLLHTAVHPDFAQTPKTFEEMMDNFFYLIEQQVRIVRPRQMLYIALDGVAPRAKMYLQRARRYRVANEHEQKKDYIKKIDEYRESVELSSDEKIDPPFDYSCITPGTAFMRDVSKALRKWIQEKQVGKDFLSSIYIVADDASVPGEGEHKIMQRIRAARQRNQLGSPKSIAISGRDADLVLLSLATHDPNIKILRQVTHFGKMVRCPMCCRSGHARGCVYPVKEPPQKPEICYALFDIKRFRSVLHAEFRQCIEMHDPKLDFELMINDFVLLTFFVGNDYLPNLAGISIRNGSLDMLIECYITWVTLHGTTLTTKEGQINFPALFDYLHGVSSRHEKDCIDLNAKLNRNMTYRKKKKKKDENSNYCKHAADAFGEEEVSERKEAQKRLEALFPMAMFHETSIEWFNDLSKKNQLRYLDKAMFEVPSSVRGRNKPIKAQGKWKKQLYINNFSLHIPAEVREQNLASYPDVNVVLRSYARGLEWVFRYYIDQNPNWEWFYPFHYGPCMSDLCQINYHPGKPFAQDDPISPLISLMAILPPASIHLIPEAFRELITLDSSVSPISDLYPTDPRVDYANAFYWWQGIMHLPEMDIERISTSVLPRMANLTEEERKLNQFGKPMVFCCNGILDLGDSLFKEYSSFSHSSGENQNRKLKVEDGDELAGIAKSVQAIPHYQDLLKTKGQISSVPAYMIPHDPPPLNFEIQGDDLGYDPDYQIQRGNKQRFGGLASQRRGKILEYRREQLKEARVMGHVRSGSSRPPQGDANSMNDALLMSFMSKMFNQSQRENSVRSRMHDDFNQQMIPSPISMGHGHQPYQSVMKSNNRNGEHVRNGEPDPDCDNRQNWNGSPFNNNPQMNAMQMLQQMLAKMMNQQNMPAMSSMSQMQKMVMLMQQMGGMSSPRNSMGGMGSPQQFLQMLQQQQQQQQQHHLMQEMLQMLQMQQAQQLATTCSDYGSDDGGFMNMNMNQGMGMNGMQGMGGMGSMGNGFNNGIGAGMGGMGSGMGSPMGNAMYGGMGGYNNQPTYIDNMMNAMNPGVQQSRLASPAPMDPGSPSMSAQSYDMNAPSETYQSPRQIAPSNNFAMQNMPSPGPGMGMNGHGWPSSPQANPMNMGMQQQQNMNPMAGMNPVLLNQQNMHMQMLNQQTNSQNAFQSYMQPNQDVNHQTRI